MTPSAWAVQEQAETKRVSLIKGLDRGTYKPYNPDVMEKVQSTLKEKGLYQGKANAEIDEPTMKAIGEFRKAILAVAGFSFGILLLNS
jgi:hypothetical protein